MKAFYNRYWEQPKTKDGSFPAQKEQDQEPSNVRLKRRPGNGAKGCGAEAQAGVQSWGR